MDFIKFVESEINEKPSNIADFKAGDTVGVYVKIIEGNKQRTQLFQGDVIQRRNEGTAGETFTVRKISNGVGVERIFPLFSPSIDRVEVIRQGKVRRARLFYLRGKHGRAAKIKGKTIVKK